MWFTSLLQLLLVAFVSRGAEIAPTGVVNPPQRTQPPTEVSKPQYAQTLYKATDHVTVKNTLIPLWPSYSVKYYETRTTTLNFQNISTSYAEFATLLNTTADYYTDLVANNTWEVAPTTYQTMDFQHQSILYTDRANVTHTELDHNGLPFI